MKLNYKNEIKRTTKFNVIFILILTAVLILVSFFSLFIGSSSLSFKDTFLAIFNIGERQNINIVLNVRMPRIISGLLIGGGLAISGLVMQSVLNNSMASPSTLGVSNSAVLGANIAIIILANGNIVGINFNYLNSYLVSFFAFVFSLIAIIIILSLAKIRHFEVNTMILIGLALSSLFQAITTLLQYFANDISLSSAIYWSFGDLGRTSMKENLIIFIPLFISMIIFQVFYKRLNALSLGEQFASSSGVNTEVSRFLFLLLSSLIIALSISFVGIIGFIGLIAPHLVKKIIGNNHKYLLPSTFLIGSLLLLLSDDLARVILKGYSLPVGAITAILGAPFFLILIFSNFRGKKSC